MYDIVRNAEYPDDLVETSCHDMFEKADLVVIAIDYDTNESPLKHGTLFHEFGILL